MKPLIVITQPRDISQFIKQTYEEHRGSKYDRLVVQYYPGYIGYKLGRQTFLDHTEYTHFICATDDIIWTDEDLEILIDDYTNSFEHINNNIILGPDMNTDMEALETNNGTRAFMTDKYPNPRLAHNKQMSKDDYHFATHKDEEVKGKTFVKCSWTSMALTIIPRRVMEVVTFNSDVEYINIMNPRRKQVESKWGCCMDTVFAQECKDNGFPMYIDMNVRILHLKQSNIKNLWLKEYNQVGKKPQSLFFLKASTNEKVLA